VTVHAPELPELDGKRLHTVWELGWRPREYDSGDVILVRTEDRIGPRSY